jgi:hypothetical protein
MQGKLTILKANDTKTVTEFDRPVTLDELQAAVGGYIEQVREFDTYEGQKAVAFFNEEGIPLGLKWNQQASKLTYEQGGRYQPVSIVLGDFAILTGDAEFLGAL